MARSFIAVLVISGISLTPRLSSGQGAVTLPLRAERSDVREGRVTVELVNVGTQTIVGWGVVAKVTYADGTSRTHEMTIDGFEQSVRNYADSPVLSSGQRHLLTFADRASALSAVVAVSAAPTLVIFANDMALGDERRLERVFAARALNQQVLERLEAVLQSAAERHPDAHGALNDAAAQMAAIESAEWRRSPAFTEFERKIAFALRGGQSEPGAARARLEQLQSEATSLHRVAVAHARRRF